MNKRMIYIFCVMAMLLIVVSMAECWGQENQAEYICNVGNQKDIRYKNVTFSKKYGDKNNTLDLSLLELDGATTNISIYSVSDSLFRGVYENDLRWYRVDDNIWSCKKVETPLLRIEYSVPKNVAIGVKSKLEEIEQDYKGKGIYCAKDSMTVIGHISMFKEMLNSVILPSLDTLKFVHVVHRRDSSRVKYSQVTDGISVIENADFYYAYDFECPIFMSIERKLFRQGIVLSESKKMYYFEIEPFLLSIKNRQDFFESRISDAREIVQNNVLVNFRASCIDKNLNVRFTLKGDARAKIVVANSLGIVYMSKDVDAPSYISKNVHFYMGNYPVGQYVVFLNVMGKKYYRVINN